MMALKEYLQQQYQGRESFLTNVVFPMFGEDLFEDGFNESVLGIKPELAPLAQSSGIESILRIGTINVDFNPIDIYDITVSDKVQMQRNRVSIQMLVRRIMDTYSSSFMIFHYKDNSSWDWRFTFCSKKGNNEDSTDSKRYTFLLGPNQSCRTAAENFEKLIQIEDKGSITVESIISAFDVEALSKEFFGKYKEHYSKFVAYMCDESNGMRDDFIDNSFDKAGLDAAKIKDKEEKPIRDYVKRLLGRIVFLHFLQKKGWMGVPAGKNWGDGDKDFMMSLYEYASESQRANFLDEILEPLFSEALNTDRTSDGDLFDTKVNLRDGSIVRVPYLNGGLFERDKYDEPKTVFPAEYFKDLLEFFYQYNFTIDENDPNDAQVGVDPEMLGRIFENLLEDNKDKGAFYTPKEIVQYMCRQALVAYLQTNEDDSVKSQIENFVTTYDVSVIGGADSDLARTLDQKLKEVKICDPAIGSGAFPMGLLKELFLCRGAIENFDNASDIKKHIIQNNIYGVDIEKGAVDIARLRFWLSLIVDEDTPSALPNLDYKIMQGNSLLESYKGIDLSQLTAEKKEISEGHQLTFFEDESDLQRLSLRKLLDDYYNCPDHNGKTELKKKISDCIQAQLDYSGFSRQGEFGENLIDLSKIDIAGNDQFFLWHTWFSDVFNRPSDCDKSGFDIVIGNPPYVEAKKLKYISRKLKSAYHFYSGTADLSIYFIELAFNILREGGIICYITTNKFFTTGYGKIVRERLSTMLLRSILDFEQVEVFEDVLVSSVVLCCQAIHCPLHHDFIYEKFCKLNHSEFKEEFAKRKIHFGQYCQDSLGGNEWAFADMDNLNIKDKIEHNSIALSEVKGVHIYRGVTTGLNPAFIITNETRDELVDLDPKNTSVIKKLLQGRNIRKWFYREGNENLLQTDYDINIQEQYPTIYQFLMQWKDSLERRSDQGKNWWNLRACKYYSNFEYPEKIIWGLTADKWAFAYDDKQHYLPSNGYILTSDNIPVKYILGWINSRLMKYYFGHIGVMTAGGAYTLKAATISSLPFKIPQDTSIVETLVDRILMKKNADANSDVSNEESLIDEEIYRLYDLDEPDIRIVEGE